VVFVVGALTAVGAAFVGTSVGATIGVAGETAVGATVGGAGGIAVGTAVGAGSGVGLAQADNASNTINVNHIDFRNTLHLLRTRMGQPFLPGCCYLLVAWAACRAAM
jgi:hypothetical protein